MITGWAIIFGAVILSIGEFLGYRIGLREGAHNRLDQAHLLELRKHELDLQYNLMDKHMGEDTDE